MPVLDRIAKACFAAAAAAVVFAAGLRVARLERRLGFGALIEELKREQRERRLPRWLARPTWLAGTLERLLPLMPPRRCGLCLRRALVLLDLWTRCGLRPTLHLGFRLDSPERNGHAWVTATDPGGRRYQVSGPLDTQPAFEL